MKKIKRNEKLKELEIDIKEEFSNKNILNNLNKL